MTAPRGRVRRADLAPGERYFAISSSTGVCVYRTRSEDEAKEIVARNPDRLDYTPMGDRRRERPSMPEQITETYTAIYAAFRQTARAHRLTPFDVRLLVAIGESTRVATDVLATRLACEATAIRRSLSDTLYPRGLAHGVGAIGGPRRPGVRSIVSLTDAGLEVVAAVHRMIDEQVEEVA